MWLSTVKKTQQTAQENRVGSFYKPPGMACLFLEAPFGVVDLIDAIRPTKKPNHFSSPSPQNTLHLTKTPVLQANTLLGLN